MLESLHVKNLALIREAEIDFTEGLNILTGDRELDAARQDARFLYEAGADALIVQDLGLARLIHAHAPDFALHASTQMTVHTLDGAREIHSSRGAAPGAWRQGGKGDAPG